MLMILWWEWNRTCFDGDVNIYTLPLFLFYVQDSTKHFRVTSPFLVIRFLFFLCYIHKHKSRRTTRSFLTTKEETLKEKKRKMMKVHKEKTMMIFTKELSIHNRREREREREMEREKKKYEILPVLKSY